jgi:hypothetical protein
VVGAGVEGGTHVIWGIWWWVEVPGGRGQRSSISKVIFITKMLIFMAEMLIFMSEIQPIHI